MSHTNLAKETLLQFMQAMYAWERKATRSLRNQADKEMLKDELAAIFDRFCTSKKTLRGHCTHKMRHKKTLLLKSGKLETGVFCYGQKSIFGRN